jgi:hypothetical protein
MLILFYSVAVAAVFSLVYKLQPAFIFIDEIDSFLGQRRTTDLEFCIYAILLCSDLLECVLCKICESVIYSWAWPGLA